MEAKVDWQMVLESCVSRQGELETGKRCVVCACLVSAEDDGAAWVTVRFVCGRFAVCSQCQSAVSRLPDMPWGCANYLHLAGQDLSRWQSLFGLLLP
jgi:hypothetical protein